MRISDCSSDVCSAVSEITVNSADEHVKYTNQQGVRTEQSEIHALCELFRLRLIVHPAQGDVEQFWPSTVDEAEELTEINVWLTGGHFTLLVPVTTSDEHKH